MNEFVSEKLSHIRTLAKEINEKFDVTSFSDNRIKNEIAGMFAVTVAAAYEGIVKDTLINYAEKMHPKFHHHVLTNFEKMNAKVNVDDLKKYSSTFGLSRCSEFSKSKNATVFDKILEKNKTKVYARFRTDLLQNYKNIFLWRHAYAHELSTAPTFNDVYRAHRVSKYVILSFVKAFELELENASSTIITDTPPT